MLIKKFYMNFKYIQKMSKDNKLFKKLNKN